MGELIQFFVQDVGFGLKHSIGSNGWVFIFGSSCVMMVIVKQSCYLDRLFLGRLFVGDGQHSMYVCVSLFMEIEMYKCLNNVMYVVQCGWIYNIMNDDSLVYSIIQAIIFVGIQNIKLGPMDSSTQSMVVSLYHPATPTPDQVTQAISRELQAPVTPYSVVLKPKDRGVLIFIELPSEAALKLISGKKITINDAVCNLKRFYCDHQIFINKLPQAVDVADVRDYFGQFGEVINVEIVTVTHNFETGKSIDFRHCYIMFKDPSSAHKIIMHPRRHIIKKEEVKTCRTYGIAQGDDTDKKIFVKIQPNCDKPEEMEAKLQERLGQFGELREKLKIEEGKEFSTVTVVMTSAEAGEEAYKQLRDIQIDNYRVTMRPHDSELALFAPGLKSNVTEEAISRAFSKFGRISACSLAARKNSPTQNATINFANEDDAKLALIEYENTPEVLDLYVGKPFLTIHMNIKQRKEFNNFNKKSKPISRPMPIFQQPPMGNFQQQPPMAPFPVLIQGYPQQQGYPMQPRPNPRIPNREM